MGATAVGILSAVLAAATFALWRAWRRGKAWPQATLATSGLAVGIVTGLLTNGTLLGDYGNGTGDEPPPWIGAWFVVTLTSVLAALAVAAPRVERGSASALLIAGLVLGLPAYWIGDGVGTLGVEPFRDPWAYAYQGWVLALLLAAALAGPILAKRRLHALLAPFGLWLLLRPGGDAAFVFSLARGWTEGFAFAFLPTGVAGLALLLDACLPGRKALARADGARDGRATPPAGSPWRHIVVAAVLAIAFIPSLASAIERPAGGGDFRHDGWGYECLGSSWSARAQDTGIVEALRKGRFSRAQTEGAMPPPWSHWRGRVLTDVLWRSPLDDGAGAVEGIRLRWTGDALAAFPTNVSAAGREAMWSTFLDAFAEPGADRPGLQPMDYGFPFDESLQGMEPGADGLELFQAFLEPGTLLLWEGLTDTEPPATRPGYPTPLAVGPATYFVWPQVWGVEHRDPGERLSYRITATWPDTVALELGSATLGKKASRDAMDAWLRDAGAGLPNRLEGEQLWQRLECQYDPDGPET